MKKIVLLVAFSLLGGMLMSCDDQGMDSDAEMETFASDDGLIPPKRPPLVVPPPPPPGIQP